MTPRQITENDVVFSVESRPNRGPRWRVYGSLKELSTVNHFVWMRDNLNEPVAKATLMLALHRKLVEHLKKVEAYLK